MKIGKEESIWFFSIETVAFTEFGQLWQEGMFLKRWQSPETTKIFNKMRMSIFIHYYKIGVYFTWI